MIKTVKTIEERILSLQEYANSYELSGDSPLTDGEYDKEYTECLACKPNDPFFSKVGGIDLDHTYGTPFVHEYVMGSLNKSPNSKDFEEWFSKVYNNIDNFIAVIDLKVDGVAFCLHYKKGKLVRAVTRGDGLTGLDYTKNAMFVKGVKQTIAVTSDVEIKGELYKNRSDFYKAWSKDVGGDYENPRGFTAGSINQKDPMVTKERGLSFVAYEVRGQDFDTEITKIKFLENNGFETLLQYVEIIECDGKNSKEIGQEVQQYMDKCDRENLPFAIDGVVFKLNNLKMAKTMGFSDSQGKKPKANRAIKFPTEQKETVLTGIEFSMGRTGAVTPVGLLLPVRLAETTVRRVSLYNLKEMKRLEVCTIGGTVLVEKAGDIIPKVIRTISQGDEVIVIPTICPLCESPLEWDETKTTLWCNNETCSSKINGNIDHWLKKIGVKGIGEGIINKLTRQEINSWGNPMVSCVSDMYKLNHFHNELNNLLGVKTTQNILTAMESVKEVSLSKFIEALGIGKIGGMASEIVTLAPTIESLDTLTIEDIERLDGFALRKATAFINGWKTQRSEISKILKYVSIKTIELSSSKLQGQKFCCTGSFSNPTRKEMEQLIVDNGGKVSSVSKTLTSLVWDEEISGGKVKKAIKMGIPIITQDAFMRLLKKI